MVVEYLDAEQQISSGQIAKLTFKDIVLLHLQRITTLCSKEFYGGHWNTKPYISGGMTSTIKYYVEDSGEAYSNAINALNDLLYPYFDEKTREKTENIELEIDQTDKISDKEERRGVRIKIKRRHFRLLTSFLYKKKYLELGVIND